MLGGSSAAGIILGYASVGRGDPRAIVLVPFGFAFLFFVQLEDSGWVARAASDICRIARRVPVDAFRFWGHHGNLSPGPASTSRRIALANVQGPVLVAYVGSSVGAIWGIIDRPLPHLPFAEAVPLVLGVTHALPIPLVAFTMLVYLRGLDELRREAFDDPT